LATVAALFVWAWRDPEWLSRLRGGVKAALPAPAPPDDAAQVLCARLDQLFVSNRAYSEFGVGLDDIARRLTVSPRELSGAVNRIHGRGFRTVLNDRRVDDAARQLADPQLASKSITEVMFDAGFQTKSNFNKEFAARLSESPSQYRRRKLGSR
jgi:AraC-like DNA-binding protein